MFKTETHLHTKEVSPCGHLTASEMVKKYFEQGYKTLIITDHLEEYTIGTYFELNWEEKVDKFLSGYAAAKQEGDRLGVNVLFGAEIRFTGEYNHYLVYGITKEFLIKHPDIYNYDLEKFFKISRENGVFIVQAHPYRDGRNYPTPNFVDGVEVYNSNPRHEDYNEKAELLAKEYNLYGVSGSDAHRDKDVAKSGIITKNEIKTIQDFITAVKNGNIEIIR